MKNKFLGSLAVVGLILNFIWVMAQIQDVSAKEMYFASLSMQEVGFQDEEMVADTKLVKIRHNILALQAKRQVQHD